MGRLDVRIKTLTPLWTGGVEGTMDRIHETGILGSLRWWYEAIVRGLGGYACDPTSDNRCPDKSGNYCDVCQVFGATGLQRAFRLEGGLWTNPDRDKKLVVKMRNHRGWHLGRGFLGKTNINFTALRFPEGMTEENLWMLLCMVLQLMKCWGGLGPKTQQGYGVTRVEEIRGLESNVAYQDFIAQLPAMWRQSSNRRKLQKDSGPSLEGFFFAKVGFVVNEDGLREWLKARARYVRDDEELSWYLNEALDRQRQRVLPVAPVVRCHLRSLIKQTKDDHNQWVFNPAARHCLMGELGYKSLIHVSHAYPLSDHLWEFRIWGWIPETLPGGVSRAIVFQHLRQWLGVTQERQWHSAGISGTTLWDSHRLNLTNVQVCWFGKQEDERPQDYFQALLSGCELCRNSSSHKGETP